MIKLENKYGGEMTYLERELLHAWVGLYNPKNILEIGTGTGGGGCYYMASALKNIDSSALIYTCDPYRGPEASFFQEFPMVNFWQTKSNILIDHIIDKNIEIDFIFFDGPEDANTAIEDILTLENFIKSGTKFTMHDWEFVERVLDKAISIKAQKIRPYMENSSKWKLLHQTENSTNSVGLCLYEFLGN